MAKSELENYWSQRYEDQNTGWDIGYPSTPIKEYVDQLANKDLKILIPGAGNAYEAEYLFNNGFSRVHVMDISPKPLEAFQSRLPLFPKTQLLQEDFFTHVATYDLIFEQTFFCSFEPTVENRSNYAKQMHKLLHPKGKLVGLWFDHPKFGRTSRPFGGSKEEYLGYLSPYFDVQVFEPSTNSIGPRQGAELFGIFCKK